MIIIYGQRYYGRVGGHGAEHLATRFAHVYFVPLFPTSSRWVSRQIGDQLYGFDVKLSARSVAAAYLRIWAPLVALGLGATLSIPGIAAAVALLALSAWSWTWFRIRGDRERRRAFLDQVAFGAACDPLRRTRADCEALRPGIEERFAEVSGGRTPDDVARFGAATPEQAAFAYALLRLVAATGRGHTARKARAASERILDDVTDGDAGALADGGPYRARNPVAARPGAELEAAAAAVVQARNEVLDDAIRATQPPQRSAWDNDPSNPAVKEEIARNKQQRAGTDRKLLIAAIIGAPLVVGYAIYDYMEERAAEARALTEIRTFVDDIC